MLMINTFISHLKGNSLYAPLNITEAKSELVNHVGFSNLVGTIERLLTGNFNNKSCIIEKLSSFKETINVFAFSVL